MFDLLLILRWLYNQAEQYYLYRRIKGGLWVHFENGQWIQCTWNDKKAGYINNKFDGGTFHTKLKLIKKIEDYT